MEKLSVLADLLAIVSLLLSMYFYFASRNKEIDEIKKIISTKSDDEFQKVKLNLSEIKGLLNHLNNETVQMLKNQVIFMQEQVGTVGKKVPVKTDVEILNLVMSHRVISIETICLHFNHVERFIILEYLQQFHERGTIISDGTIVKINQITTSKEEEND